MSLMPDTTPRSIRHQQKVIDEILSARPDPFEVVVGKRKALERDVLLSKHRDYGPKNIANAPGGPVTGLAVRLHDKLARLSHLVEAGAEPENESLLDTALDIANYGTILALVLEGQWPGTEARP